MPFKKPHHTSDSRYVKPDGNGGYVIQPRGLNIVWGNDYRYWKIPENGNAELVQVSWLEVSGKVKVEKNKTYSITFKVKVKPDGFGWSGTQVLVMAKIGKGGGYQHSAMELSPAKTRVPESPLKITVSANEEDLELHFGLYEVWSGKWKGGLEIEGAEITVN